VDEEVQSKRRSEKPFHYCFLANRQHSLLIKSGKTVVNMSKQEAAATASPAKDENQNKDTPVSI
jgi:hypothetical protein